MNLRIESFTYMQKTIKPLRIDSMIEGSWVSGGIFPSFPVLATSNGTSFSRPSPTLSISDRFVSKLKTALLSIRRRADKRLFDNLSIIYNSFLHSRQE